MKKFLSIILIITMLFCLFGCKKSEPDDEPVPGIENEVTEKEDKTDETPEINDEPVKEDTPEPDDEPLKEDTPPQPDTNDDDNVFEGTATIFDKYDGYLVVEYMGEPIKVNCDNWNDFKVYDRVKICGDRVELDKKIYYVLRGDDSYIQYEIINANVTKPAFIEDEVGELIGAKPVIYLYPEKETNVDVALDVEGKLTCVYPDYNGLWQVTAQPNGTLTDKNGREYYCLYWEAAFEKEFDNPKDVGFVVAGCDTAEFLRKKALELGLNEREANEFIIYWLPQMQDNEYNYIYFALDEYEKKAKLKIKPAPDTQIRFMMLYKPLDGKIEVKEQILPKTPERDGFTLVEWGGCKLK